MAPVYRGNQAESGVLSMSNENLQRVIIDAGGGGIDALTWRPVSARINHAH